MNRIKALAIALCAILTVCTAQAQRIVKQDATTDDYIQLLNRAVTAQQAEVEVQGDYIQRLNHAGFKVYSFDISSMGKKKYGFTPIIMKYENGKTENVCPWYEDWGFTITTRVSHFTVGVSPMNDSILQCHIFWGTLGAYPSIPFKMVHGMYHHIVSKPFVLSKELKLNEFIPLVAVSPEWSDENIDILTSCNVDEFDSNYLETATSKNSPLIYVIGVKCRKL